jgi:predicted DNA-binding WGR domain protein
MKIYFFMGKNSLTKSGVSWKIWKIQRDGRKVTTFWGRARLISRRAVPLSLRSATRSFTTTQAAIQFEAKLIRSKLKKGYERNPRTKR